MLRLQAFLVRDVRVFMALQVFWDRLHRHDGSFGVKD